MFKRSRTLILAAALAGAGLQAAADDMSNGDPGQESWLPSLITETPADGFALAVKLSRVGVKTTQPDVKILKEERPRYSRDAASLIDASHVIAVHFSTIAEANDYWRGD